MLDRLCLDSATRNRPGTMTDLQACAREVAAALVRTGRQLVLAESCTAGLVAASLGGVPGISRHLCGSAVVYQERTKAAWLDVPEDLFASPGVVSAEVAAAMTAGALRRTPFADLAAAITGHLGPGAPTELDGVVFISVHSRDGDSQVTRHNLAREDEDDPAAGRLLRQAAAAELFLRRLCDELAVSA